jgi:hypothetical protein
MYIIELGIFHVLMAETMTVTVFYDVTGTLVHSFLSLYLCHFLLQSAYPCILKTWKQCTRLHGVTCLKTIILMIQFHCY